MDDIKKLAERLIKMMPGARKYNPEEALSVAQIAVAHGLDPFNGEVMGIVREQPAGSGNYIWLGVMVGIKGLRKCARRQGNYWTSFYKVEPAKYGYPNGSVVYECHLRDENKFQTYTKLLMNLTRAGMNIKEAEQIVGEPPVFIGIGMVSPNESARMGAHRLARKRAEADAIKQAYDIDLGMGVLLGEPPKDASIIGEDEDHTPKIIVEPVVRDVDEIMGELGYGVEIPNDVYQDDMSQSAASASESRPYSPDTLKMKLAKYISQVNNYSPSDNQIKLARYVLSLLFFKDEDGENKRKVIMKYLFGKDTTKDLTGAEFEAILKWTDAKKDSGGEYKVSHLAVQEAQMCYEEAIKE